MPPYGPIYKQSEAKLKSSKASSTNILQKDLFNLHNLLLVLQLYLPEKRWIPSTLS
jgi:hypothetical protein